jgi:serine/threonine protein kinase
MLVCFIATVFVSGYHEKMFVHCDIKPSNLYINDRFEMTSDSGSLMDIGGEKHEFIV